MRSDVQFVRGRLGIRSMLGRVMDGERSLDRSRMFAACVGTQATPLTVVGVERGDQAGISCRAHFRSADYMVAAFPRSDAST